MNSRFKYKNICYGLAFVLSFTIFSCEGLDDWSDLKSIELFNSKDQGPNTEGFKSYSEPGLSSQPIVQSIYDPSAKYSKIYNSEIKKVCDYTKLPFHCMTVTNWNKALQIEPTTRVLMIYDSKKLNDATIPKLLDFVSNGGTLFIPFASEDRRMAYLLGFKPQAEYATDNRAAGFYFNTPVLPNLKGRTYGPEVKLFGFAAQNFSNKVKILATAANNLKYPTIIENAIGKGRVILYNTSGDFSKPDRGLLFAGLLKGLEGIPYPIVNASTIFLDDFPSPQYDIKAEPIQSEMNMTTSNFVSKVWWPDMRDLGKEYKIPYAAMLTFDYRNKIVPPFTLDQWNSRKLKTNDIVQSLPDWLVFDVKKNGHELAFHGYNHVSLTKKLWKNMGFISTSMNTIKKKWAISNYGKLPTTYVPPSNEIDKAGVLELKKTMPSIKYMCSLYLGQLDEGGNREFDYDPYEKKLFDYPRISSGFYFKDNEKYVIQSMYLYTGVWTHFVHPDDVYQIPATADKRSGGYSLRNNLTYGWRKSANSETAMFPEFKKYLKQFTSTYPQMRFVNGEDGGDLVMKWRASRYTHKSEKGLYTIKEINPEDTSKKYWFMFGSPSNADKIEGQLKNQNVLFAKSPIMNGYLYSIYSTKSKLIVYDVLYDTPKERVEQVAINNLVKADFAKYVLDVKKFVTGGNWVDDSEKKLKLEMAALRNKMLSSAEIDSTTWNKYAKYMSWDEKGGEVWKLYEEHVAKNSSKNNIQYSKELDRIIGYKDDVAKEKWLSEQIKVSPNDKELLNNYLANFDIEEYKDKIKNVLKALNAVDPSPQNYMKYIKHLLQYYPDEALVELENVKPSVEFKDVATQIVWLFADNAEYKKAIEWSEFSNEIDFVTIMNWYISAGLSKELEPIYKKYIAQHPEDEIATVLMSTVYHEQGRFKDAWVLANSLSNIYEKEELRKTLNTDVEFENFELQQDLIENHSALFYPDVLKKLKKEIRLTHSNFIDLNSSLETNQSSKSIQKNVLTYNLFDRKNNLHSIGATYSKYYKLNLTTKDYDDNYDNSLVGVEYKYKTAQKDSKPQYWSRARVEVDRASNPFYQFGIGLTSSKEKRFRSGEFNLFPVETAPGLNQKIYHLRLNLYQDFYIYKKINVSVAYEGSYFTEGLLSRDTIGPIIDPNRLSRKVYTELENGNLQVDDIDDAYSNALTLRFMLDKGEIKKTKFIPFIESQVSFGSRDLAVGYPYWVIKNRLFGGGGVAFEFKTTNFHTKIEGGYFLDNFSDHFERLTGALSYQLFDFTSLTLNVEVFEQSKFYSNTIQFGIKHNLKKRVKRKK